MRFPIAAALYFTILFVSVVCYIATSTLMENTEDQLTTNSLLDRLSTTGNATYQSEWSTARIGFNVVWSLWFIIITLLFFFDALRKEHEEYYPPGGFYR